VNTLQNSVRKALSRRSFLAGSGALATAAVITGCSDDSTTPITTTPTSPTTTTFSDTDILNFALNLEYLEAEFYLRAASGTGLSSADSGGSGAGATTGGAMVPGLSAAQSEYINAIAQDELNHVKFLRSALGSAAVVKPFLDFTNAFTAAAVAAGVITSGQTFNPFKDWPSFLLGAFIFEDVGVTAYTGAAPLLSSKTYLSAAAGIQAVEAYHAAEIRTLIAMMVEGAGSAQDELTAANKISALRGTLGGGNETSISTGLNASTGALNGNTGSTIVACASGTSTAFARTPSQVLHIVYATGGASGVASGGFFPNGLNGTIKTTTA
jgi:hypothetical protein